MVAVIPSFISSRSWSLAASSSPWVGGSLTALQTLLAAQATPHPIGIWPTNMLAIKYASSFINRIVGNVAVVQLTLMAEG